MNPDQNSNNAPESINPLNDPKLIPGPDIIKPKTTIGGMRVIQPLASSPKPNEPIAPVIEQPPLVTPPVNAPTQSIPEIPAVPDISTSKSNTPLITESFTSIPKSSMNINGQSLQYTDIKQLEDNNRFPWVRTLKVAMLLIVLGGAGWAVSTNQNVRASVLREKFVTYNYPLCQTRTCAVDYYKDSKIGHFTPKMLPQVSATPILSLISPLVNNKTNLVLTIRNVSLANQTAGDIKLNALGSCTAQNVNSAFSEYLPNLDATAKVCALTASNNSSEVLGYFSAINSPKSNAFYFVYEYQNFTDNSLGQPSNSSVINLADYQNDFQQILSSISAK